MKILIIGDLHGHTPKIYFKDFDAIICTGDFCLEKEVSKHFMKTYKKFLKNPYNYEPWWNEIGKKKAKKIVDKSLKSGRNVLKKLNAIGVPVYVIPGNWDYVHEDDEWDYLKKDYYKTFLIKGLKNIHDVNEKIRNIHGYNLIGYGLVSGPELLKYRHYKNIKKKTYKKNVRNYKKLVLKYNKIFQKSKKPTIFLSHNVPFNTKLDKIANKESLMNGYHYGSNLVMDMIKKYHPILSIGGHMHEHYGTCKIGKTTVLNAGYGGEHNTLIELEDGKIKSIKFHGKQK